MMDVPAQRSAGEGLSASLRRAVLGGLTAWQVVVIAAALASPLALPTGLVVAVHLVLPVLAVIGLRERRAIPVILAVAVGFTVLDLRAAVGVNDVFTLAAIWTMNLIALGPGLLLGGRRGGLVGGAVCVGIMSVATALIHPEWEPLLLSTPVTGAAIVVAAGYLTGYLHRFVDQADRQAEAAAEAHHELAVSTAAGREAAETARVMHDTAINTLAAVASGGAAVEDVALVRARCQRDVVAMEQLAGGSGIEYTSVSLADIGAGAGVAVRHLGLTGDALDQLRADVPETVSRALRGAADEAVRNAERHAGIDTVDVTVSYAGGELTVVIADQGRGFDGRIPPGHGLSGSVLGRVQDAGAAAEITSRPGHGTVVTLRWSAPAASPEVDEAGAAAVVEGIRSTACWAWAVGVVAVGIGIDLVNRPGEWSQNYSALAVVAVVAGTSWWLARRGELPGWWIAVIVGSVPTVFVLGLAAIGFGDDRPFRWQALMVTPVLVILLVVVRGRRPLDLAWAALGLAIVIACVVLGRRDPDLIALVLVGAAPQIGVFSGWAIFNGIVGRIVREAEVARQAAARDRATIATQDMVRSARSRWQQAGLSEALETLRTIASGSADPRDPQVQRRCAGEERFLRQVMLLSPDVLHLGPWLARALAAAREQGVELTVRTGDLDAPGSAAAELLGEIVLGRVVAQPGGSSLTVGLFASEDGRARLLIVGSVEGPMNALPDTWHAVQQKLGDQELLEITWPRGTRVTG